MDSFMRRFGATLIDNGYRILPLVPGEKKPGRYASGEWNNYADWARHCERPTSEIEFDIWSRWPDAGIGIACGTVTLVDIDVRDAALVGKLKTLAFRICGETPLQRVGLAPKVGLVYRTEAPIHGIKQHPVEVLGVGNQFVAYGIHPVTGRPYEWLDESPHSFHLDDLPLVTEAQLREFLAAAAKIIPPEMQVAPLVRSSEGERGSSDQRGTLTAITEALGFIPNHDLQWDDWFRVAMAMKGALGEEGWPLFVGWSATSSKHDPAATWNLWRGLKPRSMGAGTIYWLAEENGWTPSPELTLNGFIEEALRGVTIDLPADKFAAGDDEVDISALLEGEVEVDVDEVEEDRVEAAPPLDSKTNIDELLQVEGFLAEFIAWCNATAYRPQPWLALGAGLALVGTLAGRRYRNARNNRPNLYVVGIADSGGGKENARSRIKELLFSAGLERYLGGDEIASGKAVLSALAKHPSRLFQPDEFGQSLRDMLGPKAASHMREIWTNLTKLYTSAGTVYLGTEYADQSTRPRVDLFQPHCCLHATTVPEPFWAALQSGAMSDGSLARFLIFLSPDDYPDAPEHDIDRLDPPASLIAACQAISRGPQGHDFGVMDNADMMPPGHEIDAYVIPYTAEARALTRTLEREQTETLRQHAGTRATAAIARTLETAHRVAMARAISRDWQSPMVGEADLVWANRLTQACFATTQREADANIADNQTEADHKRVLSLIRKAGIVGVRRRDFFRQTHWLGDKRRREGVIQALIESGQVEAASLGSGPKGGRPAVIYTAK